MAIKRLTYRDLTPQHRETAGGSAQVDLQRMLNLPGLSEQQRAEIQTRLDTVTSWIEGTLEPIDAKVQHHEIVVTETVGVDEKV